MRRELVLIGAALLALVAAPVAAQDAVRVYVTNEDDGTVSVIDAAANRVIHRLRARARLLRGDPGSGERRQQHRRYRHIHHPHHHTSSAPASNIENGGSCGHYRGGKAGTTSPRTRHLG